MATGSINHQRHIECHRLTITIESKTSGNLLFDREVTFDRAFITQPAISLSVGTSSASPDIQYVGLSWSYETTAKVTIRGRALNNIAAVTFYVDVIAIEQ